MALLPRLLGRDYWDVVDFPDRIFDQHFGGALGPDVDWALWPTLRSPRWDQAFRSLNQQLASGASEVTNNADEFGVKLDVRHFKPEEVEVKVQDHNLTIHGKHEERSDEHGYITREFTRRYVMPENVKMDQLSSTLSGNGVLAIKAPKEAPKPAVKDKAKTIPIQFVKDDKQALTNGTK